MSTNKTFNYPYRIGDADSYGKVLSQLDDKLDQIKRQISYFDTYNITDVVIDSSTFSAQINSLPANEALVINCNPFAYGNDSFVQGDVILKIASGQVVHIKSLTGGVYYPKKIKSITDETTNSVSYTIEYEFTGSAPTLPTTEVSVDTEANIAKNMIFKDLAANTSVNIYGIWSKMEKGDGDSTPTLKFLANIYDEKIVRPFVEFYFGTTNKAGVILPDERVELEYSLTTTTEGDYTWWILSLVEDIENIYVKVK